MSQQWLDAKFVSQLSFRLRNFKKKGSSQWNFSCPICGDSKTNKYKARGYVYPKQGKLLYHCHNCNVTLDIPKLLRTIDQSLFDDYIREKMSNEANTQPESELTQFVNKMKPPKFHSNTPLKTLKKVSQLQYNHPVKQWVDRRRIPANVHFKLYYAPKFASWVNTIIPGKFADDVKDEPRLIIPFIDKDNNLFGFQGRSFKKEGLRYITIMVDEDKNKLYGVDTVDSNRTIYVVEGPIDSLFLPNSIASCGSDVTTNLDDITTDHSRFVIVYDNEPRNKETVKKMEKAIDTGFKVCIWPESVSEKDVNDMVLAGKTTNSIVDIINENVYNGLQATLRLQQWKKV